MSEILVGMMIMIALGWIIMHVRSNKINLQAGAWILISLALLYSLFVLELIVSFIKEGAVQATLVMGGIFGFVAIIIWVLIGRFILTAKSNRHD